jgi:hypothetical protein
MVGKPLPWLGLVWAGLALIWIVLAFVDPTRTHTVMAVLWSILAAVQIASIVSARRRARAAAEVQVRSSDSATH